MTPVVDEPLRVRFGSKLDYDNRSNKGSNEDQSTVYYLTDTHQIILSGTSYSRSSDTIIYAGHVDSPSDVKFKQGVDSENDDVCFIYSVGNDNKLYLIKKDSVAVELNKIGNKTIGSGQVDFIVSSISQGSSGSTSEVPSTKALIDYITSYVSNYVNSNKNQPNGILGLDNNGKIKPDQYDFDQYDSLKGFSGSSSKPVNGSSVKAALNDKVDKEENRQLSTNDFDAVYKAAVEGLVASGSIKKIDWNDINNKPFSDTLDSTAGPLDVKSKISSLESEFKEADTGLSDSIGEVRKDVSNLQEQVDEIEKSSLSSTDIIDQSESCLQSKAIYNQEFSKTLIRSEGIELKSSYTYDSDSHSFNNISSQIINFGEAAPLYTGYLVNITDTSNQELGRVILKCYDNSISKVFLGSLSLIIENSNYCLVFTYNPSTNSSSNSSLDINYSYSLVDEGVLDADGSLSSSTARVTLNLYGIGKIVNTAN